MQNLQTFDKNRQFFPNWMLKYIKLLLSLFCFSRKSVDASIVCIACIYNVYILKWNKYSIINCSALSLQHTRFIFLSFFSCHVISSNHWRGNACVCVRATAFNEVPHQVVYLRRWCSFNSVVSCCLYLSAQFIPMQKRIHALRARTHCNLLHVI